MKPPERLEVWALLAWGTGGLYALLLLYLGLRPGGAGPVLAWGIGRDLVQLAALALLGTGLIWSFLHRPFLRRRRRVPFLILVVVIGTGSYPFPYPSSYEDRPSAVRFRLPFEGEWTVYWGGESKEQSLLVAYTADRRYGLDLVVARDGKTHTGEGNLAADYFCFGSPVLAPADGVVVDSVDRYPDLPPGEASRQGDPGGNRVVIRVAEGQYVFLSHLQQGSIAVREGQAVSAGEPVGRTGSSGWSPLLPEPHLAIHLQDTSVPGRGEPIPWRFFDYVADGVPVEKGFPHGGIGTGGALLGQRIAPSLR